MQAANETAGGFVITIRGAAGPAVRAPFEDVELTVASDTTVLHRSGGDQAVRYGDPSAGPGPGPRSCRGAPNAGNTAVSLPMGARSDRPVAISNWRSIVPTQAWSSHLGPRRSTLGCGSSSRVSVLLWAAPAGTAARSEGSARTSQRATRAGRYGGPHTAPAPGDPAVLSLPGLLRRMEHLL